VDLKKVAAALGVVVLERVALGQFVRRSAPTAWWRDRVHDDPERTLEIVELFPFLEVFLPLAEKVWAAPRSPPVASEMWTATDSHGHDVHLEAFAACVDGASILVIGRNNQQFVDRQLLVQRARELRSTYDALMREIERKDILLHTIVHDLTAPLHSIVGSLSLLRECDLPAAAIRWTELATEAAARQRALIADILDVFVSEQGGGASPTLMPTDVRQVIERALSEREPVARQRQVTLAADIGTASSVVGEETRMLRVLTNLLDNAIRHSPSGGTVKLTASQDGNTVLIAVEDEGAGVSAETLPRLFDKFAHDPRAGGTGLGLYFCRITMEQWGGGIGYEPRAPVGARFWIRLPARLAEHDLQARMDDHDEVAVAR
jgi:signal transduction histidine kinase